jgi:hypothetical protein
LEPLGLTPIITDLLAVAEVCLAANLLPAGMKIGTSNVIVEVRYPIWRYGTMVCSDPDAPIPISTSVDVFTPDATVPNIADISKQ